MSSTRTWALTSSTSASSGPSRSRGRPPSSLLLTSAACPVSGVMEDQIRAGLAPLGGIGEVRIDWQWIPAWQPADMTDSGREQLRAIGFTI